MLPLQPKDQSKLLVHGQGLYRLYFDAIFCLVPLPLHVSDDTKGARWHLAPIFGGSPVWDGASSLSVIALFSPYLIQGAGDQDIRC